MKTKLFSLIFILILSVKGVYGQDNSANNAPKDVTLGAAYGVASCDPQMKPCAIINKSTTQTITAHVEASYIISGQLVKKMLVLDKLVPGENRYVGCAGCTTAGPKADKKCTGYKIMSAIYEAPDSVRVRQLMANN